MPPSVALSGAGAVTVGGTYALGFSASDPGTDTVSAWQVDWGRRHGPDLCRYGDRRRPRLQSARQLHDVGQCGRRGQPGRLLHGGHQGRCGRRIGGRHQRRWSLYDGAGWQRDADGDGARGRCRSYGWDVNGDGHDDVTSQTGSVTLSWSQLNQLGIVDAGRFPVTATGDLCRWRLGDVGGAGPPDRDQHAADGRRPRLLAQPGAGRAGGYGDRQGGRSRDEGCRIGDGAVGRRHGGDSGDGQCRPDLHRGPHLCRQSDDRDDLYSDADGG